MCPSVVVVKVVVFFLQADRISCEKFQTFGKLPKCSGSDHCAVLELFCACRHPEYAGDHPEVVEQLIWVCLSVLLDIANKIFTGPTW